MEYITGASGSDPSSNSHYFQLNYPSSYKSNETRIVKFERDYSRFLEYRFIGLFPLSLNSVRVSYQGSQVLKASAAFSFDRYICGESGSLARDLRNAFNEIFGRGNPVRDGVGVKQGGLESNVYGTTLPNSYDRNNLNSNTQLSTTGNVVRNNPSGAFEIGTRSI